MPSNWLYVDTNFPTFTGQESTEAKVSTIQNYLFMLVEQLRYSLHNLDTGNMNPSALDRYANGLTDPIYRQLSDNAGNITQLQIDAKGLQMQITNNAGDIHNLSITAGELASQIADANGNISSLQQTASEISSTVANQGGDISQLQQTASSISSTVSSQGGQISQIKQTVNSITLGVSNGSTSSTISLYRDGVAVSSQNIVMNGLVTFQGLSSGTTTIDGACIKTGLISADRLNLTGAITFGDLNYSTQNTINSASSNASAALTSASNAQEIARQIANGTYSGGTFINGQTIYSPNIVGQTVRVNANGNAGTFVLSTQSYGDIFTISYQNVGFGPQVVITGTGNLSFNGWSSITGITATFA